MRVLVCINKERTPKIGAGCFIINFGKILRFFTRGGYSDIRRKNTRNTTKEKSAAASGFKLTGISKNWSLVIFRLISSGVFAFFKKDNLLSDGEKAEKIPK